MTAPANTYPLHNTAIQTPPAAPIERAPQKVTGLPQSAAALAYAGALPPIIAAMLVALQAEGFVNVALEFMILYGGALIAFFGGVRWGVAVMRVQGPNFRSLLGGIIPLAYALPIFALEDVALRLWMIIAALPILLIDDLRATARGSGAPDWYLGVRAPLTILMEVAFVMALAAYLLA